MRIYIPGGGNHSMSWLERAKPARSVEEADAVLILGGGDVSPTLYGEEAVHKETYPSLYRDREDYMLFQEAVKHRKAILGICRGMQFITAMIGGRLIQDVNNHAGSGHRSRIFHNNRDYIIPTIHHQMCHPYPAKRLGWEVKILACANPAQATYYENGKHESMLKYMRRTSIDGYKVIIEPEMMEIRGFGLKMWGIQGHPEMSNNRNSLLLINDIVEEFMDNNTAHSSFIVQKKQAELAN